MKIVGVGDLFIPARYIERGFAPLRDQGHAVETADWPLQSFDELQGINLRVEREGSEAVRPPECAFALGREAEVFITQFCPVTRELLDACPRLKAVGVLRAGMENVCVAEAEKRGVAVFNTPGRNAEAVSDFTVGMILCEARNIARGHHGLKTGQWIRDYANNGNIPDLAGRTVGLIGCGAIGQKVARKLSGFAVRVLGHDPFADAAACCQAGIALTDLESLLRESDFISLHARLTERNRGMIGARELSLLRPTAILINTSRAGLVDEAALCQALSERRILGAALDVFEEEPLPPGHPLLALDNVTLTPHMAGGSNDAFFNTPALLRERMKDWIARQA